MAGDTPAAREMSDRALQRRDAPDEAIDLKPFDLLDDLHNAVSVLANKMQMHADEHIKM